MTTISGVMGRGILGTEPEPGPQGKQSPAASWALKIRAYPGELQRLLEGPKALPRHPGQILNRGCANCGGIGFMMVFMYTAGPFQNFPGGKAQYLAGEGIVEGWYYGETKTASCPLCVTETRIEWCQAHSGLKTIQDRETSLSDFHVGGDFTGKEEGLAAMRHYLGMNDNPRGFCTLWGLVGRGKSHLLKGLTNGFAAIGVQVRYINGEALLDEIKLNFGNDRGEISSQQVVSYYKGLKVLAIDEFDKVYMTPWAENLWHGILDERWNDRENLLTVLAMNTNPELLPPKLDYLKSRIHSGLIVEVGGIEVRRVQGMEQKRVFDMNTAARLPYPND